MYKLLTPPAHKYLRSHAHTHAHAHAHTRTHARTHAHTHTHTHTHSLSYYTLEVRYNVFSRNAVPALIIIYIDTRSKIFPPRRRSNSNASCHKCQPNIQFATDERVLFAFILITCKQRTVYVARNNSLGAMLVNLKRRSHLCADARAPTTSRARAHALCRRRAGGGSNVTHR